MGAPNVRLAQTVGVEIAARLMIAGTPGEADVVCSLLRADGIECGDRPASDMYAERGSGWGGPREVLVRRADLDPALPGALAPGETRAVGRTRFILMSDVTPPQAGWYADPANRYELRYWDGSAWTEHVSRAGQQYTDPPVA